MTAPSSPLLPCKHCGSTASFHEIEDMDDENFVAHYITCDNAACGMTTNLRFANKEDPRPLLAEQWNRIPTPSSLVDDEDERGFTPSDYAHTAELLRSSEPIRKAAASNNHNIILAALDLCARRPRPPGERPVEELSERAGRAAMWAECREACVAALQEYDRNCAHIQIIRALAQ